MLPLIQGVIARRMLLNFRADPDVVQRLLPAPLQVDQRNGRAIVGVCLIRLENYGRTAFPAPSVSRPKTWLIERRSYIPLATVFAPECLCGVVKRTSDWSSCSAGVFSREFITMLGFR